jgi:glyoxylase-like metal-dependent hydrolase (beta-lactamase superfamily II)
MLRASLLGGFAVPWRVAKFRFAGSPVRLAGDNDVITAERMLAPTAAPDGGSMTIHAVSAYINVLFLVEYKPTGGGRRLLLLDGGTASDTHRIEFYLKDVLRVARGDALGLVAISHAHVDHSGGARRWAASGVPIAAPCGIDRYFRGVGGAWQRFAEVACCQYVAWQLGRHFELPICPGDVPNPTGTKRLVDGDTLPGYDDWSVIATPGHTAHMVTFYHGATHTLYAADMIIGKGHGSRRKFVAPTPVDIPNLYCDTVRRLRLLPVRWLLMAHGGAVDVAQVTGGWLAVLEQVERSLHGTVPDVRSRRTSHVLNSIVGLRRERFEPLPTQPRLPPARSIPLPCNTR